MLPEEIGEFAFPLPLRKSDGTLVTHRAAGIEQFSRRFAFVQIDGLGLVTGRRQRRALGGRTGWRSALLGDGAGRHGHHQQRSKSYQPAPLSQHHAPAAAGRTSSHATHAQTEPEQGIPGA